MKLTTKELRWIISIIYEIFNFIVQLKQDKKDGKSKKRAARGKES